MEGTRRVCQRNLIYFWHAPEECLCLFESNPELRSSSYYHRPASQPENSWVDGIPTTVSSFNRVIALVRSLAPLLMFNYPS